MSAHSQPHEFGQPLMLIVIGTSSEESVSSSRRSSSLGHESLSPATGFGKRQLADETYKNSVVVGDRSYHCDETELLSIFA